MERLNVGRASATKGTTLRRMFCWSFQWDTLALCSSAAGMESSRPALMIRGPAGTLLPPPPEPAPPGPPEGWLSDCMLAAVRRCWRFLVREVKEATKRCAGKRWGRKLRRAPRLSGFPVPSERNTVLQLLKSPRTMRSPTAAAAAPEGGTPRLGLLQLQAHPPILHTFFEACA